MRLRVIRQWQKAPRPFNAVFVGGYIGHVRAKDDVAVIRDVHNRRTNVRQALEVDLFQHLHSSRIAISIMKPMTNAKFLPVCIDVLRSKVGVPGQRLIKQAAKLFGGALRLRKRTR